MKEHAWLTIAVGRVCLDCKVVQEKGHYREAPCFVEVAKAVYRLKAGNKRLPLVGESRLPLCGKREEV